MPDGERIVRSLKSLSHIGAGVDPESRWLFVWHCVVPPSPIRGVRWKVAQVSDDLGWMRSQAGSVRKMLTIPKGETLVSFPGSLVRFVDKSRISPGMPVSSLGWC